MADIILRDPQHAARLFSDDHFRLAPKHKFLFHVVFSINPAACKTSAIIQRHKNEINMLVKTCDLPHFTMKADTVNQYNRKKNIQTTHEYNPISIIFHDDNMGLINQVWRNYYSYYYADPSSAVDPSAYKRTATKNFNYIKNAYGLDNNSKQPFFNYIKIYQMARHEYVSYKLFNPIITEWNHNKVAYGDDNTHDNNMQIKYEAVEYDSGDVGQGEPIGFGTEHYDQTPSPNNVSGATGGGGSGSSPVMAGSASPTFNTSIRSNTKEFLNNLAKSVNTYQNTSQLPLAGYNGLVNGLSVKKEAVQAVSGLQGFKFPTLNTPTPTTIASIIKLR